MDNNLPLATIQTVKINRLKNRKSIKTQKCIQPCYRIKFLEFRILMSSDCAVLRILLSIKISKLGHAEGVDSTETKIKCPLKITLATLTQLLHTHPTLLRSTITALACHFNSLMYSIFDALL